jgi:hypothetical protein
VLGLHISPQEQISKVTFPKKQPQYMKCKHFMELQRIQE